MSSHLTDRRSAACSKYISREESVKFPRLGPSSKQKGPKVQHAFLVPLPPPDRLSTCHRCSQQPTNLPSSRGRPSGSQLFPANEHDTHHIRIHPYPADQPQRTLGNNTTLVKASTFSLHPLFKKRKEARDKKASFLQISSSDLELARKTSNASSPAFYTPAFGAGC